jgi:hypothetical protein
MNIIEYPERYAAATKARIIYNATTTFHRTVSDAAEIISYIKNEHYGNPFLKQMAESFDNYGKLSPRQVEAVRKIRAKRAERKLERDAERAEAIKTKGHVGEVKERREFVLTLKYKTGFEYQPQFYRDPGYKDILIFEDADGNVYKYTGLAIPLTIIEDEGRRITEVKTGDQYTLKATIKAHETYKGCPQTVLTRPANVVITPK